MGVSIDMTYDGDLLCTATHEPSGRTLVTDAPRDNGGMASSFSPTDLVAAALGTCMLTIMGLVARQHGLDLRGARVRVIKEMAADPARRIGALTVTVTMPPGAAFGAKERALLERGAQTCPVKHSLHPETNVNVVFEYPAVQAG